MGRPPKKVGKKAGDSSDKCSECSLPAGEDALTCNQCDEKQHKECANITDELYEAIMKGPKNIVFVCDACSETQGRDDKRLQALELKVDKLTKDHNKTNKETSGIKDIITALQKQNETMQQQNAAIQKQNDLILKLFDNFKPDKLESNIKAHVNEISDRKFDSDQRKNNLIVFRLKEQEEDEAENDLRDIKKLIETIDPEMDASTLNTKNVIRLGTKKAHTDLTKTKPVRPIKVTFQNHNQKMNILRNAKNLKDHPTFGKVGVQMDMTKSEQQAHRLLTDELKKRRDEGESVMIFDGRVILRSDRDRLVKEKQDQQ